MFRKILYPTDFSPYGNEVVNSIIDLKPAGVKEVLVLHVIDKRLFAQFPEVSTDVIEAMKESARDSINQIAEKLKGHGLEVKTMIEIGVPFHQIISLAKAEAASMVVMGSHGRSLVEEMLLGSTTENVLRHITIPLLIEKFLAERSGEEIVLSRHHKNPFEKILYPTDFSECAASVIPYLKELKSCGTKEVIVAHIQDMTRLSPHLLDKLPEFEDIDAERLAKIESDLTGAGIENVKTILKEGIPFNEIEEISNKENVGMIAVGSHGKSMVKEMLLGSISGKIVRKSKKPVLVIRRKY